MAKTKPSLKILSLFLLLVFLATSGLRCKIVPQEVKEALTPVKLRYWRVWDDRDTFGGIISAYQAMHPNISIEYRRLRYEEYEQALLEAFAEDRGPDIFSVHNTWTRKYVSKALSLPAEITLPYQTTKSYLGGMKKETIVEMKTKPSLTLRDLRNDFIDVIYDDVVVGGKVYGLPLGIDTLVLYYNKDMLNNAGIAQPPETWEDFVAQVKKLTKQDKLGNIVQAGTSLGTGSNVVRSTDILSLLMMQNGTQMVDASGYPTFAQIPPEQKGKAMAPGTEALRFYTDFANPAKEVYTWNIKMSDSLEAFMTGKVAYFLGYAYHLSQIQREAPKLNFAISPMPQIEGNPTVNFANYWMEIVSRKTKHQNEAWDFIQFAATKTKPLESYLSRAKKATVLRSLIEAQSENEELRIFASQVLTAKSWYRGQDANNAEKFFKEMIDSVTNFEATPEQAINLAQQKIRQTMR